MTCAEIDVLIAEFVEGSLHGEQKAAVAAHLSQCRLCAALAQDSSAALAFLERVPEVQAPPELLHKLLFEAAHGVSHSAMRPSLFRRLFGSWSEPILQPRFAMGMAMTMLSIAMLFRAAGISERQLTAANLDPVKVWRAAEGRANRWWSRGVQYYENLPVVYEIQSRLQEWDQEPDPDSKAE